MEINGIPENRSENQCNTIIQLAKTVDTAMADRDIQNVTRIAKMNKDSKRPRSVIVKLRSIHNRDQLLAAVHKFNKSKIQQDKLNSTHLGLAGEAKPVYVAEHLTPANKSLHASTRKKAKEAVYSFV